MATANLNKSEEFMTNTTAASNYIPSRAAKDAKDWSLPSFGSHLNPISTRGDRLCPPYTGVLGWLKFAVAALKFTCLCKHCFVLMFRRIFGSKQVNSGKNGKKTKVNKQ